MIYKQSGFTLIELLVVITIIGILATGAVTVYTWQTQKARDTVRITDIEALKWAVEQVYGDDSEYPHADTFVTSMNIYQKSLPKDPKHSKPCNDWWTSANAQDCAYAYMSSADSNGIDYWDYEISTAFENEWNVSKKAAVDGGWSVWELTRLEIWTDLTNVTAVKKGDITGTKKWACNKAGAAKASAGTELIIINWNPSTLASQCD